MKKLIGFLLLLSIWGCEFAMTTKTPGLEYQPTSQIAVLDHIPDRPHKQIGTIEGFLNFTYGAAIEHMKQKGMEMGADALVLMGTGQGGRLIAMAIKYDQDQPSPAARK